MTHVSRCPSRRRGWRYVGAARHTLLLVAAVCVAPATGHTQSVTVTGPAENPLRSITPPFTIRATGFGASRPIQYTLQVATTQEFNTSLVIDTTVVSNDTEVTVQLARLLPSDATIFWRALAATNDGKQATSPVTGPRRTLPWLVLRRPNSPAGDILDTRRPLFAWSSPVISPAVGEWRFDFELLSGNRVELAATLRNDTSFIPPTNLQANTSYRWNVTATASTGESIQVASEASFLIDDPGLPTTTILYQNFPNPFPTPTAFATCFWFDVGAGGARISLEVLDLRGNLVKTIIPADDGVRNFDAGRYGRGIPGVGNNCDNRYVWNGTGIDGRTVAAGAYLLRFQANGQRPIFRTIVFQGR